MRERNDGAREVARGWSSTESTERDGGVQHDESPAAHLQRLRPLASVVERIERAVATSPADATLLVWLDRHHHHLGRSADGSVEIDSFVTGTVEARVIAGGRSGSHRTGLCSEAELTTAIRQAMANARSAERTSVTLSTEDPADQEGLPTFDPQLADLDAAAAGELLLGALDPGERLQLTWGRGRLVVGGGQRTLTTDLTAAQLDVWSGSGSCPGHAQQATRRLGALDVERLARRARARKARRNEAQDDSPVEAIYLSPEATIDLLEMINRRALDSVSYRVGESFLREHLGVQVFDSRLTLRDDPLDPEGVPLGFDLEGSVRHPVDMVASGVARTPALDRESAIEFGLEPTAQCIGPGAGSALHLTLVPGDADGDELIAAADGGLWVPRLGDLTCVDPQRVLIRARLRGARRVVAGKVLDEAADWLWEDSLLRAFAALRAIGAELVGRLGPDRLLGALRAPAVVLASPQSLRQVR